MDESITRVLNAKTVADFAAALDGMGIGDGWITAQLIRGAVVTDGATPAIAAVVVQESLRTPSQGFRNLITGRIAEMVFRSKHLACLEEKGFIIRDLHEAGENRDFVVERDGKELPINVKTASTEFRNAKQVVGLQPEDCIPISAYKAIGASERVPDLVYADLVDFTLREKVDNYMDGLKGDESILWQLFSWYGGAGARKAQDQYVAKLFERHGEILTALAPEASKWRVISAQRVLAIMRQMPRRCPGLGVPAAGRGVFNAEVNIHVSVKHETTAWDEVAELMCREGIQAVLERIRHQEQRDVPAPTI